LYIENYKYQILNMGNMMQTRTRKDKTAGALRICRESVARVLGQQEGVRLPRKSDEKKNVLEVLRRLLIRMHQGDIRS
jgi:hypothetical protein